MKIQNMNDRYYDIETKADIEDQLSYAKYEIEKLKEENQKLRAALTNDCVLKGCE